MPKASNVYRTENGFELFDPRRGRIAIVITFVYKHGIPTECKTQVQKSSANIIQLQISFLAVVGRLTNYTYIYQAL